MSLQATPKSLPKHLPKDLPKNLKGQLITKAHSLGFELFGISSAAPHADMSYFDAWIAKGFAGTMHYLNRRRADRADPQRLLPGVKSMLCCGLNYYGGEPKSQDGADPNRAWISRYAWGCDYHLIMKSKLEALSATLTELVPSARSKVYVDTGPILERSYAASAGLGWIGKNTMLIHPKQGSYFFIGVILSDLELEHDVPVSDHCGTCRRCLDACPTQALTPYELDAQKCIAYLTIEHRGEIAEEFHAAIGHHAFGCDICQEVCPWNQKSPLTQELSFKPRDGHFHPTLESLEKIDETSFKEKWADTPVERTRWEGWQRNLNIVKKNQLAKK